MTSGQNHLEIQGMGILYQDTQSTQPICKNVRLNLQPGKIVGLIGPSGSGKTTIGKALLGALPKHAEVIGKILFDRKEYDYAAWASSIATNRLSYISQEPWAIVNEYQNIGDQIGLYVQEFAPRKLTKAELRAEIVSLLKLVSLENAENRLHDFAFEFSGGELQRIAIAFALAKRPLFLVADEPTASLDPHKKTEIYDVFKSLCKNLGLGILFITHDVTGAENLCDEVVRIGTEIEKTKPLSRKPVRETHQAPLIKVMKLSVSLRENMQSENKKFILQNLDLEILQGQITAIVGPSGAGKTTVARALTGLLDYDGTIEYNFNSPCLRINNEIRSQIGYVFQDSSMSLNPIHRVQRILLEPLRVHRKHLSSKEADRRVHEVLELVNLDESVLTKKGKQLSGGERQRINLARALVLEPAVIIADEPTSALNPELSIRIFEDLVAMQSQLNFGVLLISHDLGLVKKYSDNVLVLDNGVTTEAGKTEIVFRNAKSDFLTKALSKKLNYR